MQLSDTFVQMKPHVFSEDGKIFLDEIRTKLLSQPRDKPWKPFLVSDKDPDEKESRGVIIVGNPETLSEADLRMTQSQGQTGSQSQSQSDYPYLFQTQAVSNTRILQKELMELNNDSSSHLTPSALIMFVASNPKKLPELCQELNIDELNDSTVETFFSKIFQLDKEPSLSWCCAFTEIYFARKILSLDCFASMNLKNTLSKFCQRFPRAIVDHLMVPIINNSEFGVNHLDVMNSLLKECLPTEHQNRFLRQALENRQPWNDSVISLMTTILALKLSLWEDLLNLFTQRLLDETESLKSNVKFGKFLKSFISQYLKEFTQAHASALYSVVNQNKSLYQRGCLVLLKKIKP